MTERISREVLPMAAATALVAVALALLWNFGIPGSAVQVYAQPLLQEVPTGSFDPKDSNACLLCHGGPGMTTKIGDNEMSVQVDGKAFASSVHGKQLACIACHTDKTSFPHTPVKAADSRSYSVETAKSCLQCHQSAGDDYRGSAHGLAVAAGNNNAAVCTDCHSAHAVQKAANLTSDTSTCTKCHGKVVDSYRDSVHGQLVAAGRQDAATCTDCHTASGSTHQVQGARTSDSAASDNQIAETCGKCHTKVMENYASTFHGKAMRLGVSGAAPTCIDCHGTYGVQKVHGPEGPLDEAKVAQTCSKCHDGANTNFAGGWIGHEEPSPSWFPIVYITERFLFYLMTTTVAFGIIHVELDLLRWFHTGRKKKNGQEGDNDGPRH